MGILEIGIIIGGCISLAVAKGHTEFYRFFAWGNLFKTMSPLDGRVIYTGNLFLIPFFLLFAFLSFFHLRALTQPQGLAQDVLIFYSAFWFLRGAWQIVYFVRAKERCDPKKTGRLNLVVLAASVSSSILYAAPVFVKYCGQWRLQWL